MKNQMHAVLPTLVVAGVCLLGAAPALSADASCSRSDSAGASGSFDKKRQIFWGDLHTHTAFSMDAYVLNTTQTPRDAYVFALSLIHI